MAIKRLEQNTFNQIKMRNFKKILIPLILASFISFTLLSMRIQLLREASPSSSGSLPQNKSKTPYQRELFFFGDMFKSGKCNHASPLSAYYPEIESDYAQTINGDCKTFYNIHSHNDYWRIRPLFDAISRNYKSIEADVWYYKKDKKQELYVGHNEYSLSKYKTLRSMYLNPLLEILDDVNKNNTFSTDSDAKGIYYNFPKKSVNLLIDIKNKHSYPIILQQLKTLEKYLSYYDYNLNKIIEKQIVVTLTGDIPMKDLLYDESYMIHNKAKRYIFIDYSMCGNNILENQLNLENWSFLSSISYDELLHLSGEFPNNATKFSPLFNHSNIAGLRNLTEAHNLKENENDSHYRDTRIWGVPLVHSESTSGLMGFLINFLRMKVLRISDSVDTEIWKDLVINGAISMMNMDDLDFGMEVFESIHRDLLD